MAVANISRAALMNNVEVIKQTVSSGSKIMWVLKSNAYGHGLISIAKLLPKDDMIAVARIKEALELREAGLTNRILLLEGVFNLQDLKLVSELQLDCVLHNHYQLDLYLSSELPKSIFVWLKVDTGMHRLGIEAKEAIKFLNALKDSCNIKSQIGFMSHLATADEIDSEKLAFQSSKFRAAYDDLREKYDLVPTLSNSAAFFQNKELHFHYSRIGLALYGISPFENISARELGLQPIMKLEAQLIAKHEVSKGEFVGYGKHWLAEKSTVIGVVSIGYGDGYPRNINVGNIVIINGREVSIIGVVCMDMMLVELKDEELDNIGDKVTLWGDDLPVEALAKRQHTIPYELVCNLTRRVQYFYHC